MSRAFQCFWVKTAPNGNGEPCNGLASHPGGSNNIPSNVATETGLGSGRVGRL